MAGFLKPKTTTDMQIEKHYTPKQAMEHLGFKAKTNHTVHRLINSGKLRCKRINSRVIRIPESALIEFLTEGDA